MKNKCIIIGGSAGSFQVVVKILSSLPKTYPIPIILCLHRLKYIRSGFVEALELRSNLPMKEPSDKEVVLPGIVYLAPANYHLYLDHGPVFSLSTEEAVNHSRPSIDLAFASAAEVYKNNLAGILLSGANKDGADGLSEIKKKGGVVVIQHPKDCQVSIMTEAAIEKTNADLVAPTDEIIDFLLSSKLSS